MGKITKDNLFKPNLSRAESKSRNTDEISRAIIDDEAAQRDLKTARLRAIRLAREAEEQEKGPKEPPKKRRAAARSKKA